MTDEIAQRKHYDEKMKDVAQMIVEITRFFASKRWPKIPTAIAIHMILQGLKKEGIDLDAPIERKLFDADPRFQ